MRQYYKMQQEDMTINNWDSQVKYHPYHTLQIEQKRLITHETYKNFISIYFILFPRSFSVYLLIYI